VYLKLQRVHDPLRPLRLRHRRLLLLPLLHLLDGAVPQGGQDSLGVVPRAPAILGVG
jgi:hypothetical protein